MNEQIKTEDVEREQDQPLKQSTRAAMELIPVKSGNVDYATFLMVADRAKFLSAGRTSIPAFLKNNVADCIAVVELALAWGFQPIQVARLTYSVNNNMAFMAQLKHAVLNQSGVLRGR